MAHQDAVSLPLLNRTWEKTGWKSIMGQIREIKSGRSRMTNCHRQNKIPFWEIQLFYYQLKLSCTVRNKDKNINKTPSLHTATPPVLTGSTALFTPESFPHQAAQRRRGVGCRLQWACSSISLLLLHLHTAATWALHRKYPSGNIHLPGGL